MMDPVKGFFSWSSETRLMFRPKCSMAASRSQRMMRFFPLVAPVESMIKPAASSPEWCVVGAVMWEARKPGLRAPVNQKESLSLFTMMP